MYVHVVQICANRAKTCYITRAYSILHATFAGWAGVKKRKRRLLGPFGEFKGAKCLEILKEDATKDVEFIQYFMINHPTNNGIARGTHTLGGDTSGS